MGAFGNSLDVNDTESRVGGSFEPDQLGVGSEMRLDVSRVIQVDKGGFDTSMDSDLGEVTVSTTIDIVDRDQVRTLLERVDDGSGSGGAGSKGKTVLGTFKISNSFLKVVTVRVTRSGVFKTLIIARLTRLCPSPFFYIKHILLTV